MLGGLREWLPHRRTVVLASAPLSVAIVVTVASLGIAFANEPAAPPARSLSATSQSAHVRIMDGLSPGYIGSLPHNERASAGGARFSAAPPARLGSAALATAAIPGIAIASYEHAASVLAFIDPACHLSWSDVAGIGRVESDNGMTWGSRARVSPNGTLSPPILGPPLDGEDGLPAYPTPDHGLLEHGGKWERAVGPMQFLPSTWLEYGQDANGDGQKNPQNFWDASLAAGVFLCRNGGDLASSSGLDRAVLAYNDSPSYLSLVKSWISFYDKAGASALTAPAGTLPIGVGTLPATTKAHKSGPSPAAVLEEAARSTDSKGTFTVSFSVLRATGGAQSVGAGTATVDATHGSARISFDEVGEGTVSIVEMAGGSPRFVRLPAPLAEPLGEPAGAWLELGPRLEAALPPETAELASFLASFLPFTAESLRGATTGVASQGAATISGYRTTDYDGPFDLAISAGDDATARSGIDGVVSDAGTSTVDISAWVGGDSLVRQLEMALPRLGTALDSTVLFEARLSGFGEAVEITAPSPVDAYPVPTTPSTTTSTTTSTTSTTSTTTTTSTTEPPTTTTEP